MPNSDEVRLRHMLDAARDVRSFSEGRVRGDLDTDRQLRFAIIKCLEIIGEAAQHVSEETRTAMAELSWPEITGMRNRMIHGYYDINLDIVWATVQRDIPRLIEAVEKYLGQPPVGT